MDKDRILTLHFIDGTKLSFDFPEQTANVAARQMKIDDLMTAKLLLIEADGQLMMFPTANIKYMVLSTPMMPTRAGAPTFPRHAIKGARIRG